MKRFKLILIIIICSGLGYSCQDYSAVTPSACLTVEVKSGESLVEASSVKVGEEVLISSCADADMFSVWTGDPGADYSKKDERGTDSNNNVTWTNKGTALSPKDGASISKRYSVPGTYTITLIATNTSTGSTDLELRTSIAQKTITVTE